MCEQRRHEPPDKNKIVIVEFKIQIETSTKMYTQFLNRNKLTIWTIGAFQVLNPHQWSLAKHLV